MTAYALWVSHGLLGSAKIRYCGNLRVARVFACALRYVVYISVLCVCVCVCVSESSNLDNMKSTSAKQHDLLLMDNLV